MHWVQKTVIALACFVGLVATCKAKKCWNDRPVPRVMTRDIAGFYKGLEGGNVEIRFDSKGVMQIHNYFLKETWKGSKTLMPNSDFKFAGSCTTGCIREGACSTGLFSSERKPCRMAVETVECKADKQAPNTVHRDAPLSYGMTCESRVRADGQCGCYASHEILYSDGDQVGWIRTTRHAMQHQ